MQDAKLLLSGVISPVNNAITPQSLTGSGVKYADYSVDQKADRDVGEGETLFLKVVVKTTFAGGTSIKFEPVGSTVSAISGGTITSLGGADVAVANLKAGDVIYVPLHPQIGSTGQRYLGARYTLTGTFTAGAVTAEITNQVADGKKFYKSGFTVV